MAVVGGLAFALGQFACSNYISVELTDIVASLSTTASIVALLRVWTPGEPLLAEDAAARALPAAGRGRRVGSTTRRWSARSRAATTPRRTRRRTSLRAYAPYLIIIAVFSIAQIPAVKDALAESPWTTTFQWPGLDVRTPDGEAADSLTFNVNWLPAAGTLLLISGLITMVALGSRPAGRARFGATLDQLKWAILTVASVLALAYVMNQSGQTITLGLWAAGAGAFFAFLSPIIGWLGVAVTGSDTSSNALFGALQVTAAKDAGHRPTLLAAANSSGGVLGKMISPQNLAIGAAAVGMAGQEGDLFRKVLRLERRPALWPCASSSTCNRRRCWTGWS